MGIDICDDYSQISYFNPQTLEAENLGLSEEEASCMVPTVICKEKGKDSWFIGEEAYRCALYGKGTMVDKLVKLAGKKGTATIEGVKYTADDLFRIFVKQVLAIPEQRLGITGRELGSAFIIGVAVFAVSNLSFVSARTPFSGPYGAAVLNIRTLVDLGGVAILFAHLLQCGELRIRRELEAVQNVLQNQ